MSERTAFLILLFINLIIIIVYLVVLYLVQRERGMSIWMKAGLMFLCPVVGPLFIFIAYLCYRLFMAQAMDLEDVIFSKDRVEVLMHPDEDRERNLVSLEEALAITDKENLRTLMMNVVRGDYRNSLSTILLALNSEDSETSHYAASVLQDVLNDFRVNVQEKYRLCDLEEVKKQEAREDEPASDEERCFQNCIDLMQYMNPILEQHVLTNMEQKSMVTRMDEVCNTAWELKKEAISSECYEMICLRSLELEWYDICQKWSLILKEMYPNTLASYTCQLKLYFSSGEKSKFFEIMDELKQSDVTIDRETLEMIRTFL